MQKDITMQDIRDAFWDWQCWWQVAKSTGEIEDMRETALAWVHYNAVCEQYLKNRKEINYDEREMFACFLEQYNKAFEEFEEFETERE